MWRPDAFAIPLTQLASQPRPNCAPTHPILWRSATRRLHRPASCRAERWCYSSIVGNCRCSCSLGFGDACRPAHFDELSGAACPRVPSLEASWRANVFPVGIDIVRRNLPGITPNRTRSGDWDTSCSWRRAPADRCVLDSRLDELVHHDDRDRLVHRINRKSCLRNRQSDSFNRSSRSFKSRQPDGDSVRTCPDGHHGRCGDRWCCDKRFGCEGVIRRFGSRVGPPRPIRVCGWAQHDQSSAWRRVRGSPPASQDLSRLGSKVRSSYCA